MWTDKLSEKTDVFTVKDATATLSILTLLYHAFEYMLTCHGEKHGLQFYYTLILNAYNYNTYNSVVCSILALLFVF